MNVALLNLNDFRYSGDSTTEVSYFRDCVRPGLQSADKLFDAVFAARSSLQLPPRDLGQWLKAWRNMDTPVGSTLQTLHQAIDWNAVNAIAAIGALETDVAALCERLRTKQPDAAANLCVPVGLSGEPAATWVALNYRLLTEGSVHTVAVPVALARTTGTSRGFVATLVCTAVADNQARVARVTQDIRAQKPEIKGEFRPAIEDGFKLAHKHARTDSRGGVWRLVDWPSDVPSIDGPSAGAAAYLAWRLCLEGKVADPELIVLGQIGEGAEVEAVSDVTDKVAAIVKTRPDIDTIVVTQKNLDEAADAVKATKVDFATEAVAGAPGLWCIRLRRAG